MIKITVPELRKEDGLKFQECLDFLLMLSESIDMIAGRYQNAVWEDGPNDEYENFNDIFVIKALYRNISEKLFSFMYGHHLSNGISLLGYYLLYQNEDDFKGFFTMNKPRATLCVMQEKYNKSLAYIDDRRCFANFDIRRLRSRRIYDAIERNGALLPKLNVLAEKEKDEQKEMEEDYELFLQEKIDIWSVFDSVESLELIFSNEADTVTISSANYGVLISRSTGERPVQR